MQIREIRAQEILIEIIFTIQNWSFSKKKISETNCTKEEIFNYNKQHAVGIANLLRNYNQRMINYMI